MKVKFCYLYKQENSKFGKKCLSKYSCCHGNIKLREQQNVKPNWSHVKVEIESQNFAAKLNIEKVMNS